jgi:hypothetical protein
MSAFASLAPRALAPAARADDDSPMIAVNKLCPIATVWLCMLLSSCSAGIGGEPFGSSGSEDNQGSGSAASGSAAAMGPSGSNSTPSSGREVSASSAGVNAGAASMGSPVGSGEDAGGAEPLPTFVVVGGAPMGSDSAPDAGSAMDATTISAGQDAAPGMHRDSAVPVLAGCAAQVPTSVFAASCEAQACHNSTDREYDLDLQSPGVVGRLLNVPSLEAPALKLIDPNVPDNSFILLKVKLANPPAGMQMPWMRSKLSATETECLQQWVETVSTGPY